MKALVHTAPLEFEYRDWPTPAPEPHEVLVRVQACGICGSDVQGYTGSTGRRIPPVVMGHEAAGVIESVGAAVDGLEVGQRVCFDSTIYCNECVACRAGFFNRCARRQVLGVSTPGNRRDGAFAEYLVVPHWSVIELADAVPFEVATLFEPLSIAMHAVSRGAVQRGDTVLVIGCGTIGLLAVAAARLRDPAKIIATDVRPERLRRAQMLGADITLQAGTEDVAAVMLESTSGGADVTMEAVGYGATIRQACDLTRPGGRVVLVGNLEREVSVKVQDVIARELTLIGSYANAGEFADAVRAVSSGALDLSALVSEVLPLAEGQAAFDRLRLGEEDLLKVVLKP